MSVLKLVLLVVFGTAAVAAVNAPYCRCTDDTLTSLPPPDPCSGVVCQHGGSCEADGETFLCVCTFGYEGEFCQEGVVLTSCRGVSCNFGTCIEEDGVARCNCKEGATGVFCENDLCLSIFCGVDPFGPRPECDILNHVEEGEDPFECECGEVLEGRFCGIPFCEAGGFRNQCDDNGECIDPADRQFDSDICDCDEGFSGDMCSYGPCSDDLCKNGGSCRYYSGDFLGCACSDGFAGPSCETATCFGNSCENGGTCEVQGDSFSCLCREGYGGELCEIDLTRCFGVTCLNKGICEGTSKYDAHCVCPDGFSGDRCQFGPCLSNQPPSFCQNGGSCLDDRKTNTLLGCECAEGFSGVMCEVGPCPDDVVCENGGVCIIINGDFNSCRCPAGIFGDRCELSPCSDVNCVNGGTCVVNGESGECVCTEFFIGMYCERALCVEFNPCQNDQICYLTDDGGAFCSCGIGYRGEFCEIGSCGDEDRGCENGGSCTFLVDRNLCTCPPGFQGQYCELDACSSVNCLNGGTCRIDNGMFVCDCPSGFGGDFCQQDPCFGRNQTDCLNGRCVVVGNTFECVCLERDTNPFCDLCIGMQQCLNGGFCYSEEGPPVTCICPERTTGEFCEEETASCDRLNCGGGGICEVEGSRFICRCSDGSTGFDCENDPCNDIFCNEGICFSNAEGATQCQCPPGFSGEICENGSDPCCCPELEITCHTGTCVQSQDGQSAECVCPEGSRGTLCEIVDCPAEFTDNICQNGGTCGVVSGGDTFAGCDCPEGYAGKFCQLAPCVNWPCQNGSTCIVDGEMPVCVCLEGLGGEFCEVELLP